MDKKRNAGIDLLRILCMTGVCIIHAVGYGWGGHALTEGNYVVSEYTGLHVSLLAITTVAVNIYFLMSGFFHSKFRWRKLIEIIVEGSLYSCAGYIFACVLGYKEFGFLPLCRRIVTGSISLWFIVVYIIIYCFSDYIIGFLDRLSDVELKKLLIIYVGLNTILGFVFNSSPYGSPWSVMPMTFVYILGYAIRRWDCPSISWKIKNGFLMWYLLICALSAVLGSVFLYMGYQQLAYKILTDYRSPLLILAACSLFIHFLRSVKFESALVSKIAIHVLAVYMITDGMDAHSFIWLPLNVPIERGLPWYIVLLCLLLYIIILMFVCILIDCLREYVYKRIEKQAVIKIQECGLDGKIQ